MLQKKDENFLKGIAQNAIQLESALSNRKRKANEMEEGAFAYKTFIGRRMLRFLHLTGKNAKFKARTEKLEKNKAVITKLESENDELRDRLTKVEQKQLQNDNSSNICSCIPGKILVKFLKIIITTQVLKLNMIKTWLNIDGNASWQILEDRVTDDFLDSEYKIMN